VLVLQLLAVFAAGDATLESGARMEVIAMSSSAEHPQRRGCDDLGSLEELVRDTPGAHPIDSVDELRSEAFETDEELDEFLAFVAAARHADLA
jgi:hypothetical protein